MNRLVLVTAATLIGFVPVLAQEDGNSDPPKADRRGTFASVRALANTAGPGMGEPESQRDRGTKDSIRRLAGAVEDAVQDANEAPEPRATKREVLKEVRDKAPVKNDRKPVAEQVPRRVRRRPPNDLGRQQDAFGFQPWVGDPWIGGWGNGFYSNRIAGYRSYRYSGYGSRYGWPYYPAYGYGFGYGFGFGFSAVMPSISGPVTTRYADPISRQHKMMDDSIRRFAEDPTGSSR